MLITLSQWPQRRRPNTTGSRTAPKAFISDLQWKLIEDLFEEADPSPEGGRPRVDARACLEGILWVLKNWRSMAGVTRPISLVCIVLAATQAMDRSGLDGQSVGAAAQVA